ncbi:MAG: endolytic transglycosylase MltG [Balneolaceae bacterium]
MNLKNTLSFTKNDFLIGILSFCIIFFISFGSRQLRLSSLDAIKIDPELSLKISDRIGLSELVDHLDSSGVDYDKNELLWSARMLGWRTFRKGNYTLVGDYSYDLFLSKLARGIQDPVPVVILPGINVQRFSESVGNQLSIPASDIQSVFTDSVFLNEIGFSSVELFGRMLPETYLVYWTSTSKDLIRRILREFNDKVADEFKGAASEQNLTIDEMLTMASIVEWEANKEEEKPIISGLYWNRFNKGMRLQADPTINFALGERRRLLFEDYQLEHPYNTYLKRGLPPGPITNPSLSTIEATIFPQKHDYIYMVANPEGGHVFTRTFEEHQVESEKWRTWLRQQYRIKRQKEAEEALNN